MTYKVYYNSACPVCNAGIKDQRQRMEQCHAENPEWVDIHSNPEALAKIDSSLEQVRERLHVCDAEQQGEKATIYRDKAEGYHLFIYGNKQRSNAG